MPNSALENAVSINSHVSEPIVWPEYRISRGEYSPELFECPDAELGMRCRDVCLDEFIACINDCGSETEERFHDALLPTPDSQITREHHRVSINLKTNVSVRVTVRGKIRIANMVVRVVVDALMVVQQRVSHDPFHTIQITCFTKIASNKSLSNSRKDCNHKTCQSFLILNTYYSTHRPEMFNTGFKDSQTNFEFTLGIEKI